MAGILGSKWILSVFAVIKADVRDVAVAVRSIVALRSLPCRISFLEVLQYVRRSHPIKVGLM